MRFVIAACFIGTSALNSWMLGVVGDSASLSDVVGGADVTFAGCVKCTTTTVASPECLHAGNFDPCSTITCIKNVRNVPNCSEGASGKACVMTDGTQGSQTNFDQPCSSAGGWVITTYQAAGKCQPAVTAWQRCKTGSCGDKGNGYATSPLSGKVCK